MIRAAAAIAVSLLCLACSRGDELPTLAELAPGAAASKAARVDSRSLADLAHAIAEVEKGDPDDADIGYSEIVSSFRGKRFRWQMFLIPALCGESQCNALPFKDGGKADGIVAGWMPRLDLAEGARKRLLEQCGAQPQCPFTVEGTLAELVASTEKFTSLSLEDVALVSVN